MYSYCVFAWLSIYWVLVGFRLRSSLAVSTGQVDFCFNDHEEIVNCCSSRDSDGPVLRIRAVTPSGLMRKLLNCESCDYRSMPYWHTLEVYLHQRNVITISGFQCNFGPDIFEICTTYCATDVYRNTSVPRWHNCLQRYDILKLDLQWCWRYGIVSIFSCRGLCCTSVYRCTVLAWSRFFSN